jgi:hypothetical protein
VLIASYNVDIVDSSHLDTGATLPFMLDSSRPYLYSGSILSRIFLANSGVVMS